LDECGEDDDEDEKQPEGCLECGQREHARIVSQP
jgi:hypothetical protein